MSKADFAVSERKGVKDMSSYFFNHFLMNKAREMGLPQPDRDFQQVFIPHICCMFS